MFIHWTITLCCLLCFIIHVSNAQSPDKPPDPSDEMICKPFGSCEPCPEDALQEPFCRPFGNRRLMHCIPKSFHASGYHALQGDASALPSPSQGETPAWQSCGRIPSKERSDFFEFVLCNALFALTAMAVLFMRSKRLQIMQARQLAARIGFVRGPGGVLVRG